MKWLVQEFLNNASNSIRMMSALDKRSVDYLLVKINPDRTLTVIDKELRIPCDDSIELLQDFLSNEKIMVYGSKLFATIAEEMGLSPGSFMNEKFEFEVFRQVLGDELLNNDFAVGELSELTPTSEAFFIRPTGCTKLFTGKVVTREEFLIWQQEQSFEGSPYTGQPLMVSPLQEIEAEYRFFIVDQKIVTSSSYQVNGSFDTSKKPSLQLIQYTKKMVDLFPLAEAFVIDVAETKNGFKVIEYNNINSSGLYDCDEEAIVKAINALYENRNKNKAAK